MAGRQGTSHRTKPAVQRRARRRRAHNPHIEATSWLGAGAVTLGVGAALIGAAGSAHADTSAGAESKSAASATSGVEHHSKTAVLGDKRSRAMASKPVAGTAAVGRPTSTSSVTPTAAAATGIGSAKAHSLPAPAGSSITSSTAAVSRATSAQATPLSVSAVLAYLGREIQYTFFNRSPTANPAQTGQSATGVVTGNLNAADTAGNPLTFTVTKSPTQGTVTVAGDGSYTYTPNATLTASGGTDSFTVAVNDGAGVKLPGLAGVFQSVLHLAATLVGLSEPDTVQSLVQVSVTPVAVDTPVAGPPGPQTVNLTTGVVTGALGFSDPGGLPLTYTVGTSPGVGSVSVDSAGTFTYTPTTAARVAAAGDPNPETDSFAVVASNGLATATTTITVPIVPAPTTGSTTTTVAIAGGPYGLAVTPDGSRVYVTDNTSGSVSVLDTATDTVTKTITVGAGAEGVAITPNGAQAYVANFTDNTVSVIDTATNAVTKTIAVGAGPADVAVTPDGAKVYVTNDTADTVSVIDTSTGSVSATVAANDDPAGLAISPNGTAYVANFTKDRVFIIGTDNLITLPATGTHADSLALSPDGSLLYVGESQGRAVAVIDTATRAVLTTFTFGFSPLALIISPDGAYLYANGASGPSVVVISTSTGAIVKTIPGGNTPVITSIGLAISPDGTRLYIANLGDGTVSIVTNPNS